MFLQVCHRRIEGISVNGHLHRVANRLRWVREPTFDHEETQTALEDWVPEEDWETVHHLLVGFG